MKFGSFGVAALLALVVAGSAQAQPAKTVEVGAFGQYTKIDDKLKIDNVVGIGGRLGISLWRNFSLEGDIQTGSTKALRAPFEKIDYQPFRGLLTFGIPVKPGSQKVLLMVGGGYMNSVYRGRSTANEYEDGATALAGIRICSANKWVTRLDGVADFLPSPNEQELTGTSRNFGARAGVSYLLRGDCNNKPAAWELALTPENASMRLNERASFALAARQSGNGKAIALADVKALVCRSSDGTTVTVDNSGSIAADNAVRVTGSKVGSATITCAGTWKNVAASDNSTASVTPLPPVEWTLTMEPTSASAVVPAGATFRATARAASGDLGAMTSWMSSNTSVATVNNGVVTCVSEGTSTITATKTALDQTKTATATMTCKEVVGQASLDSTLFSFSLDKLTSRGEALMTEVATAMKRVPAMRVAIEGHTDKYGSASLNESLAMRRANRVADALVKAGISRDRIFAKGFGESCLLTTEGDDDTDPPSRKVSAKNKMLQAPNRRVEIWELKSAETGAAGSCRGPLTTDRVKFADRNP